MTRSQKGHYRAKHPEGTQVDAGLRDEVGHGLENGRIACRQAFEIVQRLKVPPLEVGKAIDLQEGRIHACQLGLFGYGSGEKRVRKAAEVADDLAGAINADLTDGRLACRNAWQIAENFNVARMDISSACEAMGIKIGPCQLGAF